MTRRAVITGVSGFLGGVLAAEFLRRHPNSKIIGVIRDQDAASAQIQTKCFLDQLMSQLDKEIFDRSEVAVCQLSELPSFMERCFKGAPYTCFHCAANTDFAQNLEQGRRDNVYLTQMILAVVRKHGACRRFVHMSTAFVCGKTKAKITESVMPSVFHNFYEQTKWESEEVIRHSGIPFTILRPSIVVGDSKTGFARHFRVFYGMFRLWLSGRIPRAPLDRHVGVDIVPVDHVVNATIKLAFMDAAKDQIVQICAGRNQSEPRKIFDIGLRVFEQPEAKYAPQFMVYVLRNRLVSRFLDHGLNSILETFEFHFPYMGSRKRSFDTSKCRALLGDEEGEAPPVSSYGHNLFQYCLDTQWGKRELRKG